MNQKFKKLERYATASFAVWPFRQWEIHNKIVIIGLNPSAKIKFGENFHAKKHQFDRWYEKGFSQSPFKGCYMTDLIACYEPNSSIVIQKWKDNEEFKNKNITNLKEQFKILGIKKSTPILCIGKNTMKLFSSAFTEYKHVFAICHPNSSVYRIKNKQAVFLRDIKK